MSVHLHLATMPPSVNRLYSNGAFGKRTLSAEGRQFKAAARMELLSQLTGAETINGQHWQSITICFQFEHLLTKTKKAKSRFVRIDVHNFEKVLIDLLAEVFNIDDSCFSEVHLYKTEGTPAGVDILVEEIEHAGLDTQPYRSLLGLPPGWREYTAWRSRRSTSC